jgi:hypothetical protein
MVNKLNIIDIATKYRKNFEKLVFMTFTLIGFNRLVIVQNFRGHSIEKALTACIDEGIGLTKLTRRNLGMKTFPR